MLIFTTNTFEAQLWWQIVKSTKSIKTSLRTQNSQPLNFPILFYWT